MRAGSGAIRDEPKRERAKFFGSMPALVTPFKDGRFDQPAFGALIDGQISAGPHGFAPVGMMGEGPTLMHEEHRRVLDACIEEARGLAPVIAGAESNSSTEAIEFARHADRADADAAWVVTLYYNRPTQEGLYRHVKAVNDAVGIPILIYNIPLRSVVDTSVDRMWRLYDLKTIVGVKNASGSAANVSPETSLPPP